MKGFILVCFLFGTISLNAMDRDFVIKRINEIREEGCDCGKDTYPSTKLVVWSDALEKIAQLHADDMNKKNYFSHKSPKGSTPLSRAKKLGYKFSVIAENIAKGQKTELEVIEGWMNSKGHCENIMSEDVEEIGLAKSGEYWVLILAATLK